MDDTVKFLGLVAGIYVCYAAYGWLKEDLTRQTYDGEKFPLTSSLVFFECVLTVLTAAVGLFVSGTKRSSAPLSSYLFLAGSNTFSMMASTQALRNLSYPSQVLAKSCKAVPMMIFNVARGRKSYNRQKWIAVGAIVAGVTVFTLSAKSKSGGESKTMGFVWVFFSLCLDGVTGSAQTELRSATGPNPSAFEMMLGMNAFALIFAGGTMIANGEVSVLTEFVIRHPEAISKMIKYAACSAFGQVFIYLMLKAQGPERLALVTTTRKFFTLLISFVYFGHAVNAGVALGVALVFFGGYLEKSAPKEHKKKA